MTRLRSPIAAAPFALAVFSSLALATPALAEAAEAKGPVPLIPLKTLFGAPEKTAPQIAPDGKKLTWLAPDANGVLNVWIRTIGTSDDKQITHESTRPIGSYFWSPDGAQVIYAQDAAGDENFHLFGVELASGNVRDLTPFQGVRAEVAGISQDVPGEILVSLNLRDRHVTDVYRLDLKTGGLTFDTENPGDVLGFLADAKLHVLLAQAQTEDGGTELRVRDGVHAPWRSFVKVGSEENVSAVDFSADGTTLFMTTSVGADTARFISKDLKTGTEKVLATSAEVDVGDVRINPRTHVPEAVAFMPDRLRWTILDPAVKADYEGIAKLGDGECSAVDRDLADDVWLAACDSDHAPIRYFSWNRATKKGTFLFSARPALDAVTLAPMKPVTIAARDGLSLHGYLTLPVGIPAKKLPAVLVVHGGPWARDTWGYDPHAQWLANRGYAVLEINFRGSTGYGKKFLHAGDRQWGLKMHDDLLDGVSWMVKQGIADPAKVAVLGGSYGGYAALEAVTATPTTFACAVDICGPSSITTLFASIPAYWKPFLVTLVKRVGDPNDPKDADLIRNASPLFKADKIVRPLMIGQGANDPRVKQAEAEQIVAAIAKHGGSVTYVLYSDEGHGFHRQENSLDFNYRADSFFAKYLGGRFEPLSGKDGKVEGSTAVVRVVGSGS
jgi:dipeptidyl aminopeptidase/acylaminoacyl peptidase